MSAPYMKFFVGDYLRDTRGLTAEQHGAYLLLLMSMWNAGGELPDDDRRLARLASCTPARWAKIKADIIGFFQIGEGAVRQKRLGMELEKAQEKSIIRARSGSAGGTAKSLKDKEARIANATLLLCHLPEPEPEREKEDAAPPPDGGVARPPIKPSGSSGKGGSLKPARAAPAGDRVDEAVRRAQAEEVLADNLASDEDRFWALKYRLADKGIDFSRAIQLANEHRAEGYRPVIAALEKVMRARNPSSYLGGVLRERKALAKAESGDEDPPPKNGRKPKFPPAIQDWFDEGYHVESDGPGKWIVAGVIRNDDGDEIGW